MRAVRIDRTGGPEVLTVTDLPAPEPGPGQVLVDVEAAGVNFIDTYRRGGVYPLDLPAVLGSEGAGRVARPGPGVEGFAAGQLVAWKEAPGSYAEQVLVPAAELVPVPEAVGATTAAAVLLQGLTAHYLATDTFPAAAGTWALVHAGAGGVGLLLTQVLKLRGANVLTTVSTPAKAELSRAAGADDVVVGYAGATPRARELTGGLGVDVVYDGVGRDTFDAGLDALRPRGLMVVFGGSSGQVPPFDVQRLNAKGSLFLTRPTLRSYTRDRAELLARTEEVFGWITAGRLDVRVGGTYPLTAARRAHEDLEGRRTTGKLLLVP
ncbi:quinone oxidoreductase family protein [Kineococcus radiotolerans]|uniref:Alcohol dehydrogenase zinc-binding domain protein n=1 Tax=Kineococcus radiotolerans (strain ATCC BAA-149 / DSM 14245 / SRS30216) TaxID=266940 RepID=A6W6T8_KINRD|nr:quinone oxidoreductase [Kineococcus radiotolerans]ABS02527.1 Alcohol dehydrogenase zinc-binding domain protein [Kineococcus radiotolerans SRS30216 = ATCC BAA-149]